jgi:5-methylcytosine-specific restriction endonuclease McrA
MDTYHCNKCQADLPREAFSTDRQKPDGRRRTCKECDQARRRARWQANLDREHERAARYRRENAGKVREAKRRYQQSERGRILMLEGSKRYAQTERGRLIRRENSRRNTKTPKGVIASRLRCAKRRALLLAAEGTFTRQEWQETIARQADRCFHCGRPFTKSRPATMDHVTPLSKGGRHSAENIVAACRVCNSRKWNRMILLV